MRFPRMRGGMTDRGVPFVAGTSSRDWDNATPPPFPSCDACKIGGTRSLRAWRGDLVLCVDAAECAKRYRGGVSAETFAAGLRGELLAVAP